MRVLVKRQPLLVQHRGSGRLGGFHEMNVIHEVLGGLIVDISKLMGKLWNRRDRGNEDSLSVDRHLSISFCDS